MFVWVLDLLYLAWKLRNVKSHITFTSTVFKVCALIFQYAYMLLQGHVSNPKIALQLNSLSVSITTTINYTTRL